MGTLPTSKLHASLRADCQRCQALCCVASAFEPEQGFAFAKAAFTPCSNLDAQDRCSIHAELSSSGFPACVNFDCYGAGQRATQQWLHAVHWRDADDPTPLLEAYLKLRDLHAVLMLLDAATRVFAGTHAADAAREHLVRLDALADCDLVSFQTIALHAQLEAVRAWLKSLRPLARTSALL
jgi:hypothetical protein